MTQNIYPGSRINSLLAMAVSLRRYDDK